MDSSWPENLTADREKAIGELVRGQEFANQLRVMLGKPTGDDGSSPSAEDLVLKVLGSFTETLSIFMNCSTSDEVSQVPANTHVGSPCWDARKSEDSGDSSKTSSASKDRRGCYKRRKTAQTWTRLTPTLIDDGHAWRKYGQKVILNAKYPRNYYRCTHKYDQGCQATKQVQRTEDDIDTPMYRTIYNGDHTCKNLLKAPQIILDSTTTPRGSSILLSFGSNNKPNDNPFFPSFPLIKQECKDDQNIPSLMYHNQSSSSDYLMSPDLTAFESSGPMTVLSSGSDHGDVISSGVYSCTASTHSLEMDLMVGPVDGFDDMFQFEFE
uniref:Putative WRKY transcription factor 70 n=1 Tax=Davidia involucrata TaxID=16924 RepID=A0A5B6YQB1_DAVIN